MSWAVTNETPGIILLVIDTINGGKVTAAIDPEQADAMALALMRMADEARGQ